MRPTVTSAALALLLTVLGAVVGCRPGGDGAADGAGGSAGHGGPVTADAGAAPRGLSHHPLSAGGHERAFDLYVPATLPTNRPTALVVMLHGGFGTAEQARGAYGWDDQANRAQFVVAYPDGLGRAWAVGGGCCGQPGRDGTDDVAFIEAVVAEVARLLPVDPARVYATGMSNGAMLTYRLACESSVFAAFAPVAGTLMGECAAPGRTSILHIHGLADSNVPFDGSAGDGFATIDGPSIPAVVDQWRRVDACGPAITTHHGDVTSTAATCADGTAVELVTIAGAGHQWPGSRAKTAAERLLGLDPPSTALDATATIWRFFAAHHR